MNYNLNPDDINYDSQSSITLRTEDNDVSFASDDLSLSTVGNFTEVIGTNEQNVDLLSGQDAQIVYGLAGRDSISGVGETSILVGGSGDNIYQVAEDATAIIIENKGSNDDILHAALGRNNPAVVGLEKATSFFAEIDERHLYLGDTESNLYVVLINWQTGKNRIETFGLAEGNLSYDDFVARFQEAEGYRGNLTWSELAAERNLSRLGLSTESFDSELELITERALELESSEPGTVTPEPNPEPEPDRGRIGKFFEVIGTDGFDSLTGSNFEIIYGVEDGDSLVSGTESNSVNILVGGTGRNIYSVLADSTAVIFENSGNEDNVFFSTVRTGRGIDRNGDSFIAADVDGRHLYFGDTESNQYVFLVDWQQPDNQIETFYLLDEIIDYDTFVDSYRDSSGYLGELSWSELTEREMIDAESLGFDTDSFDDEIDSINARASELESSETEIPEPEPEPEPDPGRIGKFTEVIGTDGFDSLTGSNFEIIYGVGDRDSLVSGTEPGAVNILVGGTDRTLYSVLSDATAIIFENSGNDDDVLFTTVRTGRGIDRNSDSFIVADIDGRHLYIGDTESEQYAFLVDWQQPDNQIETFYLLDETISYDTLANSYRDSSGYLGELSWSELVEKEMIDAESLGFSVDSFDDEIDAINARALELEQSTGSTIELFRFRNTAFDTGTYIFVGEAERDFILNDENLRNTFALDGVSQDGTINPAFVASSVEREGLIPFFRLESLAVPGTFVFVSNAEYDFIFDDPVQSQQWKKQGFDPDNEELDVAEFYLYEGSAGSGTEFNRFQNQINGTFLYAAGAEIDVIEDDPNLNSLFSNQGVAFRSLSI